MANRLLSGDLVPTALHHRPYPVAAQQGFAYVLLLIAIAVIGIVASNSASLGALMSRRDAEQSLLAVGAEFETALRSYAGIGAALNAPNARGPRNLEDLLKDPRSASIRRHLRQIYADPLTGKAEWGILKDSTGAIVGIYSLADGQPIKQSGFEPRQAHFEESPAYSTWIFGLPEAARLAALSSSGISSSSAAGATTIASPR